MLIYLIKQVVNRYHRLVGQLNDDGDDDVVLQVGRIL